MRKTLRCIMSILLAVTLMCMVYPTSSEAGSTRKCYGISSSSIRVYSNSGLSKGYGWIYGSDEICVLSVYSKYCKVTYPTSRGNKTGYISTGAILWGTSGKSYKASGKITTYKRPGGSSYGYIAKNDTVTVLGSRNGYVQVKYPVSFGYKYGFVNSSVAKKYIYGSNDHSNISDGTYYLRSGVASNRFLDVSGKNPASGANIHIWKTNNTDSQKFKIERLFNGAYKILTFCGKSLDVDNFSNRDGANVLQWDYHGDVNQQWKFISAGNGYYYIQSGLGKYLDVSGGNTANGTNVQMWTGNSTNSQKWRLESVPQSDPTPVTLGYDPYTGVNYTNKGLSAERTAVLNKAKQMVTIRWTAPCDFPTWASSKGVNNRVRAKDGTVSAKFMKGKTYTGIPYSMTDHSYDDIRWSSLLKRGISTSSMTGRYLNYPVKGTSKGIDCSYFVYEAIKSAAGSGRISYQTTKTMLNSRYYKKIDRSSMKPGDIFLKSGHVMMYVGMSGNRYAVFEADADDSKCSYNTYSQNYINSYGCYKYVGFRD